MPLPKPLAALVIAASLLASAPALAGSPEDDDRAVILFEEGAKAYFNGDYAAALVDFKRAYQLSPNANISYNIALAHIKLGNWAEALDAARRAQTEGGLPPENLPKNIARVRAIERIQSAPDVAEGIARKLAEKKDDVIITPPDDTPTKTGPRPMFWVGVAGVAVGAVALGGAGLVETGLEGDVQIYRDARAAGDPADALRADIEGRQQLGRALIFGGAGVAALGVVLIAIEVASRPSDAPAPKVSLGAGRSLTGVTFSVEF